MGEVRLAFCGASGTGKTTLAEVVSKALGLPINPVGSRSVSKNMGFDSPYDVDKAGKRKEFQHRLVIEKAEWESEHRNPGFVTDRTTLDNLAYTMLHDISAADATLVHRVVTGLYAYTHVIFCPVSVFCNPGDDHARVKDMTYHHLFDVTLKGLVDRFLPQSVKFGSLMEDERKPREEWVLNFLK